MAYKVYISSTYKDIDLARDLAHRLEEVGVEVYSVDKAEAGENLNTAISRDLSSADEVVVIITDNSVSNPNLMFEMGAALSLRTRVTPVIIGIDENKLPSIVKGMKYIEYPDMSKYISELGIIARAKEAASKYIFDIVESASDNPFDSILLQEFNEFNRYLPHRQQLAIDLWLKGFAFREIGVVLHREGYYYSHVTIRTWIKKAVQKFLAGNISKISQTISRKKLG